jgi:hypothetical protein
MPLDRHKTIRQALQYVEENPEWPPDSERPNMPVWEIVARNLFEIANNPDTRKLGSLARSTRAQRIILDRLTGKRRAGTAPAATSDTKLVFRDLTLTDIPNFIDDDEPEKETVKETVDER